MPEILEKLRPDRDLQCYFFQPSAIAALSNASANGFTLSGCWRQQFDWAVVEWNRDNVFEHPAFRSLPDGDLSGLTLSYEETRVNCIPLDSPLYATVAWPHLRIWADDGSGERIYYVPIASYATPVEGSYVPATATLTLGGTPTDRDYIGISFLNEQYNYQLYYNDTLESALAALAAAINLPPASGGSPTITADASGHNITLTYLGNRTGASTSGAAGNRLSVYTFVSGAGTEQWSEPSASFSGGQSPSRWKVTLPLGSLAEVPAAAMKSVRKMRWTFAADLNAGAFERSEFEVVVSNWSVSGNGREYSIAGPGSHRIEDTDSSVRYTGDWHASVGNFSGSTIHVTPTPPNPSETPGAPGSLRCTYKSGQTHSLYLGTRITSNGGSISVTIDGGAPIPVNLQYDGEDTLIRYPLGQWNAGTHTVEITCDFTSGRYFFFDFLEIAIPAQELPTLPEERNMTLATDWDTEHSIALAPERTAWILQSLGFTGRANHYVGALWFYELTAAGNAYASGTVTFQGAPEFSKTTSIVVDGTTISHQHVIGETPETLALAFALLINFNSTGVWAQASGGTLTIQARAMGAPGNSVSLAASTTAGGLTITVPKAILSGGKDPQWLTDLEATPRINRAARDWCAAYFAALQAYGIDACASFSTELGNGDPSVEAGIAQRYPDGNPVLVNTPALQTNFSSASLAYWRDVYLEMAGLQANAGLVPYLQFGEVQWWYFPETDADGHPVGMPFYDAEAKAAFEARYGRPMQVITDNTVNPSSVPEEAAFLPALIGQYTAAIRQYVKTTYPDCRFEVLYPNDVNAPAMNHVVNYAASDWTPENLTSLKTESFGFTLSRDLNLCRQSIEQGYGAAFGPAQRSHLVGISDASTPWLKESRIALGDGFESVVLWALDQFCLVGYGVPLVTGLRKSAQQG
jgi:hypothetical protein